MQYWHRFKYYISYQLNAVSEHSAHSPFLFNFITEILKANQEYYVFKDLELLRDKWKNNTKVVSINDLGVGSSILANKSRTVSSIAKYSLLEKKYAQLLFKMVLYYKPNTVLELGTSLGLTSMYLASARKNTEVYTVEGCSNIFRIANDTFKEYRLKNIHAVYGNFDAVLEKTLKEIGKIDFAFIDGNHAMEPTLRYFNNILEFAHQNTIIVMDDIYWSEEMTKAWNIVKKHKSVTQTIDLYRIGIVFLDSSLSKENFVVKY